MPLRKAATDALVGQGVALATAGVLRHSRQRLIAAHERVRRDVAGQLHDDVQGKVLALKGRLDELMQGISPASATTRVLGNVIDGLNQTIEQQVSLLSNQLYPSTLREGLVPAFQSLRDQFGTADVTIEIESDEVIENKEHVDCTLLPVDVTLAAYRIAEEALTNVVKHANAVKATVRLDSCPDGCIRLTVQDDGQGFDVETSTDGLGLGTMQDYAEAVEGEFSIHSGAGMGTEVMAVLPLSRNDAPQLVSSEKGATHGNAERDLSLVP